MTPGRFKLLQDVLNRRQPDLVVLADGLHKSRNIAAIARTCDAVGVLDIHAVAPRDIPRHHMTTAGSSRWTRLYRHASSETAITFLQSRKLQIICAHASETASDFRAVDYCQPCAIVFGSEVEGPSNHAIEQASAHIRIPMIGMVESLNVSVAAALVLYEAQRQRDLAGFYTKTRLPETEYKNLLFEWAYPDIARRCRTKRLPYPTLTADGRIHSNPFAN